MTPVHIDELDSETRAKVLQQIHETDDVSPSPSTTIVKAEKSKIILAFTSLADIQTADDLTDKELFESLRIGFRIDSQVLGPLCASFLKRFKKAKKEKKDFHGFKNLTRACPVLTGYSSQQVRNLAAGTPTPVKRVAPKQLTAAEQIRRDAARKLQEKQDVADAISEAARNRSNAESRTALARQQEVSPDSPPNSVFPVSHQEFLEVRDFKKIAAAKEATRLSDVEATDALLDYILKSIKVGTITSVAVGNKIYNKAEKIRVHRSNGSAI
jgi:hypothetical protein